MKHTLAYLLFFFSFSATPGYAITIDQYAEMLLGGGNFQFSLSDSTSTYFANTNLPSTTSLYTNANFQAEITAHSFVDLGGNILRATFDFLISSTQYGWYAGYQYQDDLYYNHTQIPDPYCLGCGVTEAGLYSLSGNSPQALTLVGGVGPNWLVDATTTFFWLSDDVADQYPNLHPTPVPASGCLFASALLLLFKKRPK